MNDKHEFRTEEEGSEADSRVNSRTLIIGPVFHITWCVSGRNSVIYNTDLTLPLNAPVKYDSGQLEGLFL